MMQKLHIKLKEAMKNKKNKKKTGKVNFEI